MFHWHWTIKKKTKNWSAVQKICTSRLREHYERDSRTPLVMLSLGPSPHVAFICTSVQVMLSLHNWACAHTDTHSHSHTHAHTHIPESTISTSEIQTEETRIWMQSFSKVVCDRPSLHPGGEEETRVKILLFRTGFVQLFKSKIQALLGYLKQKFPDPRSPYHFCEKLSVQISFISLKRQPGMSLKR